MIVSVHIAKVDWRATPRFLRRKPDPSKVVGLRYAETTVTAPLSERLLPSPQLGRVGMIAAWDDDAALDAFSANHPLAEPLSGGWHVRLEPLHVYGAWSEMPDLPAQELPVADEEPVAVLTLGQLRLRRVRPFLRASARAEGEAVADPALLASTGLARPPRMVATFSLWRSAAGMRDYAHGRSGGAHPAATKAHRAEPFHHESAFVRFRPYASRGNWGGRDPLAAVSATAA
jgi:hypothetical protein